MNGDLNSPDREPCNSSLDDAVRAATMESVPDDAIERVKRRAKDLAQPQMTSLRSNPDSSSRGRKDATSVLWGVGVAAALLVMVTSMNLWQGGTGGQAFAQVVAKIREAATVQFHMSTRMAGQHSDDAKYYLSGNRIRIEQLEGRMILLGDLENQKALLLDTQRKLAQEREIDDKLVEKFANPIEQLRKVASVNAKPAGEEILNGKNTEIYRLDKFEFLGMLSGRNETRIWVDPESRLPLKIEIRDLNPKHKLEILIEGFVWNQPLEEELFSAAIPEGFKVGEIMVAAPKVEKAVKGDIRSLDAPDVARDGILSRDRVPSRIVWDSQGTKITALMREPEKQQFQKNRLHELRQWDSSTGILGYSEDVDFSGELAGSADGKLLATVSSLEIQLRNSSTGKTVRTFEAEKLPISLDVSPDGKYLAAGLAEWEGGKEISGGVQIWDAGLGKSLRMIPQDKVTRFVRFSVDGKLLASSSTQQGIRLWDVESGNLIREFPGRVGDFSPDGLTFAAAVSHASESSKIDIYNLSDGTLKKSLKSEKQTEKSYVLRTEFSPNGKLLAVADWDGSVTIWDVESGEKKNLFTESEGVHALAFSPDGSQLAIGSENRRLVLKNLNGTAETGSSGEK